MVQVGSGLSTSSCSSQHPPCLRVFTELRQKCMANAGSSKVPAAITVKKISRQKSWSFLHPPATASFALDP